jgi:ATP-dependent DNA ligase
VPDAKLLGAPVPSHGLEGIVSKRATSRYRSGPSKAWIKTKNVVESEFVLLGLERDTEGRPMLMSGGKAQPGLNMPGWLS